MEQWEVTPAESGMSLLAFLKSKLDSRYASRAIKRLVDAGKCRINGKAERFASKLVGKGDLIAFDTTGLEHAIPKPKLDISRGILYSDADILAFNKPSGISSESKDLLAELQKVEQKLILLHRLDKETSGVLLFAKNLQMAKSLLELFKQHKIEKTYLALVDGIPTHQSGIVDNYLGKLSVYQGQAIWGAVSPDQGLHAKTSWQITQKGKEASLLICSPETGRTHQIRVHLSSIGHPILGDHQYGRLFTCKYVAPRIFLHASEIAFDHPRSHKRLHIAAPMPEDFKEAIMTLMDRS